jgi:hypothetical protein
MALTNISFGGQDTGGGSWDSTWADQNALFLRVFGGEVFTAFAKYNVTMDKHRVRSISSGKSAQFPFTGRTTARRYKPGTDILTENAQPVGTGEATAATTSALLGQLKASEKIIKIDDLLISSCFIDQLDEAKSHYDYRGPFSRELGRALAHEFDINVLKSAIVSARANTGATDPYTASTLIGLGHVAATPSTATATVAEATSAQWLSSIYYAAQSFDEKYVPEDERYVFVRPSTYYDLVKDTASGNGTALLHRDYSNAGNGDFAEGFVLKAAGMTVVKTPHLPSTDTLYDATGAESGAGVAQNPGENNDYQADNELVGALCWHPEAVGTVKLRDITMESEYQIRHQGDLMVAKMAVGHGGLRPECVALISGASG